MNNKDETNRWFKDSKDCLESAKDNLALGRYRTTVQNAQLCIELSAKAVISLFEEPRWTHNPSAQLREVIEKVKDELLKISGDIQHELMSLALLAEGTSQWHGLSTYGQRTATGWIPAVDLCTKDIAEDLFGKADSAYHIASKFLSLWK